MRGLDALLSAEVTSVSRKEQQLGDTSAAVYVLTRDEIRRSGMRTVPDLLRLVPGLHVAQATASKWSVSSRGMGGLYAKHLLVMIDGRSIYTPYFAGVFWDAVDVPVDLIDRIEVVRGPGASLWGANAVNGVINIITTTDVVGRETTLRAGAGAKNFGTVVHGDRIGDLFGYQVFGSATAHPNHELPLGGQAGDDWRDRTLGGSFRGTLNARDTIEGSGRAFASRGSSVSGRLTNLVPYTFEPATMPVQTDIWNASLRWTRQLARRGHLQTEVWTDEWWRTDEVYDHHRRSTELSVQYRPGVLGRHDLTTGAGYRVTRDESYGSLWALLDPETDRHAQTSAYVQDEISLAGDRAHVVIGAKVEHRDHIGWNAQPTARLHWRFTPTRAAWAAVSRAMRAPDRVEQDTQMNLFGAETFGMTWVFSLDGHPEIEPEWLTAYEAGYRTMIGDALTVDLAAYYNRYRNMITFGPAAVAFNTYQGRPYLELNSTFENLMSATTAGGEALAVYAPQGRWKVTGSYSLFAYQRDIHAPAVDFGTDEGGAPRHQAQVRYSIELPHAIDADVSLFAASAMPQPAFDVSTRARLDARVAWRPIRPLELSLVMQNLTDRHDPESSGLYSYVMQPTQLRRSAYGSVSWTF